MTSPVRAPRSTPRSLPTATTLRLRPDLRIVGDPRRRTRTGLVVGAVTVVVFGALFAGAVAHSLLVSGQVHLDDVGVETRAQREQLEIEQLDLAELQSPERIARQAGLLGMVPARQQNWVSPVAGAAPVVTGAAPEAVEPSVPAPPSGRPDQPSDEPADQAAAGATDGADGTDDDNEDEPVERSPDTSGDASELASSSTGGATAEP